jgi:hypothetical protein
MRVEGCVVVMSPENNQTTTRDGSR